MHWALLSALLALTGAVALQEHKPQASVTENVTFGFNESVTVFSTDAIRMVSFGYPRVFSNLLWVRFLEQTPTAKVPPGQLSWIYFDLDSIASIDPEFMPTFNQAGMFLSVITEDKKGAEQLLLKGIRLHPQSWKIRANLAYHYQFELNDSEKAAEQYLAASMLSGAPALMAVLAAKHKAKDGNILASIVFLEQLKQATLDEKVRATLQERIDTWKEKMRRSATDGKRN